MDATHLLLVITQFPFEGLFSGIFAAYLIYQKMILLNTSLYVQSLNFDTHFNDL